MSAFKPQIEYQNLKLLFSLHCKVMKKFRMIHTKKNNNKSGRLHIQLFFFVCFLSEQHMGEFLGRNKLVETCHFDLENCKLKSTKSIITKHNLC